MKYLVLIVLLSAAVANASSTGGTGGATGGATGGPNSEWARAPHAEPARLHNGRIVLDGAASGSASGGSVGGRGMPPPVVHSHSAMSKPEVDGDEKGYLSDEDCEWEALIL